MRCLNCNSENAEGQVFCNQCLEAMEGYPVAKGTPVIIPVQPSPAGTSKKQVTQLLGTVEEQLQATKLSVRRLRRATFFLAFLFLCAAGLLAYFTLAGTSPAEWIP